VAAAVSLVAPGLILPVVVRLAGGLDIRVTVSIALIVLIVDIGLVLFGHMIAPLGPRAHRGNPAYIRPPTGGGCT